MSHLELRPNGTFLLTVKLFTDDFAHELRRQHQTDFGLEHGPIQPQALSQAAAYIGQSFRLTSGGKPLTTKPLRIEQNHEATWVYLQGTWPKAKHVVLHNALFVDRFADQRNLLIVQHHGKQEALQFDTHTRQHTLLPKP